MPVRIFASGSVSQLEADANEWLTSLAVDCRVTAISTTALVQGDGAPRLALTIHYESTLER